MKKLITGVVPILLLVLALTFMTSYKQWDDLSDTERYQIQNYVEAAETEPETESTASDNNDANAQEEEQPESDVASSNIEEVDVNPNESYAVTEDNVEQTVTVHDQNGNSVFEAPKEKWEANQAAYYEKFNLSSY
ncbi:hypothetical protein [Oceanobacillus locisalsi]|uniref:Uncharacterized protein n=1 Tax=Oceanobacillus locisalsi TaxID=546107 RepID=A0ABW3NKZ3_9BACI